MAVDRQDRVRIIRSMIDAALEGAPDDVCGDPMRLLEGAAGHPFSRRFVRAVHDAGYTVRMTGAAGTKRVGGIRQRMELEDLVDIALVAAQRKGVTDMLVNDQARDRMAERLCDSFSRKVTLVKPRESAVPSKK